MWRIRRGKRVLPCDATGHADRDALLSKALKLLRMSNWTIQPINSVPKELTAPLLNAMIEKILIHEATTNEDNERIQEIEIYYRFIGKVD